MYKFYSCLACFLLISACDKQTTLTSESTLNTSNSPVNIAKPTEAVAPIAKIADVTYCFKKSLNKDVTNVRLVIVGDDVTGLMNWVPYQKDSARGTLKGTKNTDGKFELFYQYMIEGNQQTETKIMKVQNKMLWIKKGELLDPKNDGNLIFKDAAQAKFQEGIASTDCKNLTE